MSQSALAHQQGIACTDRIVCAVGDKSALSHAGDNAICRSGRPTPSVACDENNNNTKNDICVKNDSDTFCIGEPIVESTIADPTIADPPTPTKRV
jgi:hypothetical protein